MRKLKKYNLNTGQESKSIFSFNNNEPNDDVKLKKINNVIELPTLSSNVSSKSSRIETKKTKQEDKKKPLSDIYEEIYLDEDDDNQKNSSPKPSNFYQSDLVESNNSLILNPRIYSNSIDSSDEDGVDENDFIKNKKNFRNNESRFEIQRSYLDNYNNNNNNNEFHNNNNNIKILKSNSISFSTKAELENKTRMRSKSIVSTKSMLNKKPDDESDKRRNIIDIIRKFNGQETSNHEQTMTVSNINLNSQVDEIVDSSNNYTDNYSDYYTENQSNFNYEKKNSKNLNESNKMSVGFSIVYGIFLFFLGVFFSLDTYAGKLGNSRLTITIFFGLLYSVSIIWLLFLFFDINKYTKELSDYLDTKDNNNEYEIDRRDTNKGFYGVVNSATGENVDIYERGNLKSGKEEDYPSKVDLEQDEYLADKLVNIESEKFSGYLVDNFQPYNMYLKAGIGIFCGISLLQCCAVISEGIETFIKKDKYVVCSVESYEIIDAFFQLFFSLLQFLFIYLKGNIVICRKNGLASVLTMHLAITNLIVWFKNILLETIDEYYEHIVEEELLEILPGNQSVKLMGSKNFDSELVTEYKDNYYSFLLVASRYSNDEYNDSINEFDCHSPNDMILKKFLINFKKYMYPATIEFSITMATLFVIIWYKIGKKNFSLPPTRKNLKGVGNVDMPFSNLFIMLDCTKTSKGLFFGLLVFVGTILSIALFMVYNGKEDTTKLASLISEIAEIVLLLIALVITIYAFIKVRIHYQIAKPQINMFDIVLEIFSLFGVYAFSINSLVALFYIISTDEKHTSNDHYLKSATSHNENNNDIIKANNYTALISSFLSIIQGTLQTLFILECLRRYARDNGSFLHKPARELITALLMTNISMWFYDTLSAKKFDSKPFLVEHFGILKWSIINAFSSPIAIFYRFHSSVCLSDIWYGLYYGEMENEEEEKNSENI